MTKLVNYQLDSSDNPIATITLQNGKANALSSQVFKDLNEAFDQAEKDGAVVILTSAVRLFSGGYDLKELATGDNAIKSLVATGSRFTIRMLNFPFPIVVAVPGHSVAKGAFITMCADYGIGVEGDFKIGLNETAIGMTMHHVGIELARASLDTRYFHRAAFNAEMFGPLTAVDAGFIDLVVQEETLQATAKQVARQFAKLDLKAFGITKQRARTGLIKLLEEGIELDLNEPVYFSGGK